MSDRRDPKDVMEAAAERLADAVLLVLYRFTSSAEDSPGIGEEEIAFYLATLLPRAFEILEERDFAGWSAPETREETEA